MPRPDVDEVDVDPVDLGRDLRQRVELRLGLAPVVVRRPVAREFLQRRELHALRPIFDELLVGPARRENPSAKVGQLDFRNVDPEGADYGMGLHRLYSSCRVSGDDKPRRVT